MVKSSMKECDLTPESCVTKPAALALEWISAARWLSRRCVAMHGATRSCAVAFEALRGDDEEHAVAAIRRVTARGV